MSMRLARITNQAKSMTIRIRSKSPPNDGGNAGEKRPERLPSAARLVGRPVIIEYQP